MVETLHSLLPHLAPRDGVVQRACRVESHQSETEDDRSDADSPVGGDPSEEECANHGYDCGTAMEEPPDGVLHLSKGPAGQFHSG